MITASSSSIAVPFPAGVPPIWTNAHTGERPRTYCGDYSDPPSALNSLIARDQWVVWKWQRSKNGEGWTKPPYRADSPSDLAANNNPQTWATHRAAVAAVLAGKANGIGFVLTGINIGALDLDKCRDPQTGKIDAWAQWVLDHAPGAYSEITVSGTGLRIIGTTSGAAVHRKFSVKSGGEGAAIEIYRGATRYITVSGLQIGNCHELPNIDTLIDVIVRHYTRNGHDTQEKDGTPERQHSGAEVNLPESLQHLIEHGAQLGQRSDQFHHAVGWLKQLGWNAESICALLAKYPEGIASKFKGRVEKEVARSFDKCDATTPQKEERGFDAGWARPHPDLEERQHDTRKQSAYPGGAKAGTHDWDDPDWSILDDRRGTLPEFPLDVLGAKLQALIKRTAQGAGVTTAHVAVPMLGIVSSLVGLSRRVKATTSWLQPMTCWTALIGYSGTGKTPGINVTKRAVKQVERDSKGSDDAKRLAHETRKESATAVRDKWKKAVKDAIENNVPAPPMPVEATDPGKFIPPKLYVSDGTIERLAELLQARPQGILFLRDELSGLFTNMSRYSSGQDNEFWLEAWNGDSFNVERMGRVLHVDHLLIGIAGGMQPDKLVKSFEGDCDGMYARVLFSWPTEPGCPELSDEAVEIDTDIQNIIGRVNKLAELTEEGTLVVRDVPLNQEAREEFAQLAQFAHREKDALEGREREWFAKMTAHVLRLSGALAFLPWAMDGGKEPAIIDQPAMSSAITLVKDYFWPHARACIRLIGLTDRHTNARRVLRWLMANHKPEISREEVRREALSQRLDADQTAGLLASLCNSGWMREKISPSGPQGGKPPRRWLVNPKLFSPPLAQTADTAETYTETCGPQPMG